MADKAKDYTQKYKDYVMTGFLKSVAPIVVEKARGVHVTDVNGKEYLDCFAGISVVNAGHCNPEVVAAAKAQMDKLVHCSSYLYHVQPVADLAEKLAQITPGRLSKSFFGNGGAEAIRDACLERGLLIGVGGIHGNVIRFQPPLIITKPQIDQAISIFTEALSTIPQPAAACV
jgi:4-aminobutyrate aminotransferase-like enzyme